MKKIAPKKSGNKSGNQVRIIGGRFKRRQLKFIDAEGLRPTPDRLRETIFNWLMGDLQDAKILDLCAGSGVLGIECISRGAKHATLIEKNTTQANQLKNNIAQLQIENQATILNEDATQIIEQLDGAFDVIFIDPPYALNLWQTLIALLDKHGRLHQNSIIYLEADKPLNQIFDKDLFSQLTIIKHSKVGQAFAYLLKMVKIR